MIQNETIKLKFDNSFNGRFFAVQGDTGRVFNLQVFDDFDVPVDISDMTLRMYIGNSKEVTYADGEVANAKEGKVKVQVYNSQLKYPGKQRAQFILKKSSGERIGTKLFDLWVEGALEAGSSAGRNVYIDFERVTEAVSFLKDYNKTLEEAKDVNFSLKVKIKEGTDTREDLANCKKKALEIKSNLETTTTNAQNILNEAVSFKDDVESIKNTLVEENTKANSNISNLESKIAEGKQTATNLENKISDAKTTKGELEQANTAASNTKQSLESTTTIANDIKTKLDNSNMLGSSIASDLSSNIIQGGNLNSNLAASISSANSAKRNLDGSISNAESTNTSLKATDTEAKKTESLIRDLMSQLKLTKDEVQGIIASGNLDQYITDPKLEEALKSYATKEDLSKIDVTGQLDDYAKKSDIKTKLSEMTSDSTHRTVTDSEKATWDTVTNKVAKVIGKGLSTNDFTDVAKEKVDAIPSNPKYTDTVTTINDKTGAISKADIVALGIPSKDTTYGLASQSSNGLMSAADKKRLDNIKEQIALTETQYNALSSTQQNDSKKIYFIKA